MSADPPPASRAGSAGRELTRTDNTRSLSLSSATVSDFSEASPGRSPDEVDPAKALPGKQSSFVMGMDSGDGARSIASIARKNSRIQDVARRRNGISSLPPPSRLERVSDAGVEDPCEERRRSRSDISTDGAGTSDSRFTSLPTGSPDELRRGRRQESRLMQSMRGTRASILVDVNVPMEMREWDEVDEADLVFAYPTDPTAIHKIVKGGTAVKLVERLTWDKYPDPEFLQAFMLTYRSFLTPVQLLELLVARYSMLTPLGLSQQEQEEYTQTFIVPVRLRVYNVLKYWLAEHAEDFIDDASLTGALEAFVKNVLSATMNQAAGQLTRMLENMKSGNKMRARTQNLSDSNLPVPLLPKAWEADPEAPFTFMDLDPVEIARQLTLIEFSLYRSIKPIECVNKKWSSPTADEEAPHINAIARRFNVVSGWMASEILQAGDVKNRAAVLKRFIQVAVACRSLNNFNSVMEIISGLHTAAIYRLKKTWDALSKNTLAMFKELESLTSNSNNYKTMREVLHHENPPCTPYLGMFLTDLTFIEDGMKARLDVNDLVNFLKLRKVAVVIKNIQLFQNTQYLLVAVPRIQEYLTALPQISDEERYRLSLQLEPREK